MKKRSRKKSKGFTLLELLVVIAIIAILAGIILAVVNTSHAKAADARTKQVLGSARTAAQEEKLAGTAFNTIFADPQSKTTQTLQTLSAQSGDAYKYYADTDNYAVVFPLKAETGYWCVDAAGVSIKVGADAPTGTTYNCSSFASTAKPQLPPGTLSYGDNTTGSDFEINIYDANFNSYWAYTWSGTSIQVPPGTYTLDIFPIVFGNYTYTLSCSHTNQFSNQWEAMFFGADLTGSCSLSFH